MVRAVSEVVKVAAHEDCPIISISDYCSVSKLIGEELDFMYGLAEGNDGQIDGAASRMSRLGGYIAIRNDGGFIEIGVELSLSLVVFRLLAPAHKVVDCFLRAIGIIDDQRVAQFLEVGLNVRQCVASTLGEDDCLTEVAIYYFTYEVFRDCVTWLENNGGIYAG